MQPQSQHQYRDIKKQIQQIQMLFQNKQLDDFVDRVEKYILPHYEKDHHSGKYKERIKQKEQMKEKVQQSKNMESKLEKEKIQTKVEQFSQQKHNRKVQQPKIQTLSTKQQQKIQTEKQPEQNTQAKLFDENEAEQLKQIENELQEVTLQQKEEPVLQDPTLNNNNQQLLIKEQIVKKQQSPQQQQQPSPKKQLTTCQQTQQQIKHAIKHSKIHILQKYDEMKLILFKIEREMQKLQTPMAQSKQWKVNKINATSSIGVKTKGTIVEIRYQGLVETNIFNLCVMIYLSQLYKEWVPFCTGSKTITEPSPLQKIVLMDLKIPFLTERYAYLHGIAIDRITKNGKLYIYAEGITHEKQLLTHVHKADKSEYQKKVAKSVVLDAKYMVCQIGNEGNGKYSVKVYGMLDSHMPLLPQKVVNYIVKQLGGMIFDKIVKRAKDIKGTPWEKELKENEKRENKNKFYQWLNERITNWDKTEAIRRSKI